MNPNSQHRGSWPPNIHSPEGQHFSHQIGNQHYTASPPPSHYLREIGHHSHQYPGPQRPPHPGQPQPGPQPVPPPGHYIRQHPVRHAGPLPVPPEQCPGPNLNHHLEENINHHIGSHSQPLPPSRHFLGPNPGQHEGHNPIPHPQSGQYHGPHPGQSQSHQPNQQHDFMHTQGKLPRQQPGNPHRPPPVEILGMQSEQLPGTGILPNRSPAVSQHEKDIHWVKNWKRERTLHDISTVSSEITIPECREHLKDAMLLIQDLWDTRNQLHKTLTVPGEDWSSKLQHARSVKAKLETLRCTSLGPPSINALQEKIKKADKKRARIKRKRQAEYLREQENIKKQEQLHEQINQWLACIQQKVHDDKREKEIKAAADETLAEVRRKLSEAKRALQLIEALHKLRELRKDAFQKQAGLYTPKEVDVIFEQRTSVIIAMLEKQLPVYEREKKTLEVMLEHEAEENKEQERKADHKEYQALMKRTLRQLKAYLFGPPPLPENPLLPHRQFYDAAEQSLEGFKRIRREWDVYLVPEDTPDGSKIPVNWVLPTEPSSSVWASALRENQQQTVH